MTTITTDPKTAMQRMAAISRPPATVVSEETDAAIPVVVRHACGYSIKSNRMLVRVMISFPPHLRDKFPDKDMNRDVTGMHKVEVAKLVMLLALEYLIEMKCNNARLLLSNQLLVDQFNKVRSIVPNFDILPRFHEDTRKRDVVMEQVLDEWQRGRQREHSVWLHEQEIAARIQNLAPQRLLYVDASMTSRKRLVGVGYAISDVWTDPDTGGETWNLQFGATRTSTSTRGQSTLAELQAILHVVASKPVLDLDIKKNRRGLVILSDSKWGITILNAVRNGKHVHSQCDFVVMKAWTETAREINKLLEGIDDVTFKWVKGHSKDKLNDAADRLALASRRNIEFQIAEEDQVAMNTRIVNETVDAIRAQLGVKVVVAESLEDTKV